MFHYRVFAASECSFPALKVAGSFSGFQAVAGAPTLLQTVAGGFNLLQTTKKIDSASAFARAILLSIEGWILTVQTSPIRRA